MHLKQLPPGPRVLSAKRAAPAVDLSALLAAAAAARGVSQVRAGIDILCRLLGPQRLHPAEYGDCGMYRPGLSTAERAAFVGEAGFTRLNVALWSRGEHSVEGLLNSKVLTELFLRGAGVACAETLAVARAWRASLPFAVLRGPAAIMAFLREPGRLPLFGKPDRSALGIGAASLLALDGDRLTLGDGRVVSLADLAAEITRDYPEGYLFQRLLLPHPVLRDLIGPVIGTLRVITLLRREGPKVIWAVQKMPAEGAMVDSAVGGRNAFGLVDADTGRILRAQSSASPMGEDLVQHPITGAVLPGAVLPHVAEAIALTEGLHALFHGLGTLAADVMITPDGPVVNELNLNPGPGMIQRALGRGALDADTRAAYREALALCGRQAHGFLVS